MVGFLNERKEKVRSSTGGGLFLSFLSIIIGGVALFLFLSFVSYLYVGSEYCEIKADMKIYDLFNSNVKNYCGVLGAKSAYLFMLKGIGICAFIFVFFLFFLYFKILKISFVNDISISKVLFLSILFLMSSSLLLWYFYSVCSFSWLRICIGEMNLTLGEICSQYLGRATPFFIVVFFLLTLSLIFDVNVFRILFLFTFYFIKFILVLLWRIIMLPKKIFFFLKIRTSEKKNIVPPFVPGSNLKYQCRSVGLTPPMNKSNNGCHSSPGSLSVTNVTNVDKYKKPDVGELLFYYSEPSCITEEEQKEIVSKIIKTFSNFNINLSYVQVNPGPILDIYEFRVDEDSKISKVRSLEENLCLSLSAVEVVVIAPLPGKSTIGIGVFNNKRKTLSLKQVLLSLGEQVKECYLPIVFGRDMFNNDKIVDLSRLPHLLVAGATGQGKSVGLNSIIASLLFLKLPDEVKFILVDPKKVEFSLFEAIRDHFFVTLNDKRGVVVNMEECPDVFAMLCSEMDMRYDILKENFVRNIQEYNLLPNVKKMKYIVVVIDEFADLILTFKEKIEKNIVRLSQLSRAVGIHMIIATQHPTVDVITGLIKANFPARVAYKVASLTDSLTILGSAGAEKLLGNGDALINMSSTIERVQMPYISTEEIRALCDYIQRQK